jgi:hypothetical protein
VADAVPSAGGTTSRGRAAAPPPEADPRDDEPSPDAPDAVPAARTDPEQAAISLLESTLGARRMDSD